MKAMFSEQYYRNHWNEFLKPVPGEHFVNLEASLEREMKVYQDVGLPESAIEVVKKMEAEKIANRCLELVRKEMAIFKGIERGESSLGYTTQLQEIQARGELRKRFEFNCLQLTDFKKKYSIA